MKDTIKSHGDKIKSQDETIKSLQTEVGNLNARVQNHLAEKLNNLIVQVVYNIEHSLIVEMFKGDPEYDYLKDESHFDIILEDPFVKQTIKDRIKGDHLYQALEGIMTDDFKKLAAFRNKQTHPRRIDLRLIENKMLLIW